MARRRHHVDSNEIPHYEYQRLTSSQELQVSDHGDGTEIPHYEYQRLTSSQKLQVSELIKDHRKGNKSWFQRHTSMILFLVLLISVGVVWKRIGDLETELLSKTVDIGFDVALTLVDNNPELLGENKLAGLLRIAERHILQAVNKDIPGRLGNMLVMDRIRSEILMEEADNSMHQKQNMRALTLYKLSYEVFKRENPSVDDIARRIGLIVAKLSLPVQLLVEAGGASSETAINYGVKYMERLLTDLRPMEDVTPSVKALAVGRCSVDLVHIMLKIGEIEKAVHLADDGIATMENEFGEEASRYQYYGYLLNNQGLIYEVKNDFEKAATIYGKSLEAKMKAMDYASEENKKADLDMTKNSLARAQSNAPPR